MNSTTVLVCGHGRCGSSLVMQMLQAGGFPCFGEYPAFEPDETGFLRDPNTLLPLIEGRAAKILDPQRTEWPKSLNARVLWLDRDRNQQAKSQVKMLRLFSGMDIPNSAVKNFSRSYGEDTAKALGAFREIGINPLRLKFEDILAKPLEAAIQMEDYIGVPLRIHAMMRAVIPRHPDCRQDMSIELSQVGERA